MLETPYSQHLSSPTLAGAIQDLEETLNREIMLTATARPVDLPRAPGKWSRKQILGHLIDSAVNNHQRFVRAQIPAHLQHGVLMLDGYAQNDWVQVQDHQSRDWAELVALWVAFNRHILHVMKRVDPTSLTTPCIIGHGRPLSFEAVLVDYVGHVKHHLTQILE